MSYIVATVCCLFIEMPVSALQKAFVPQLSKQRNSDIVHKKDDIKENNNVIKKSL